MSAKENGRGMEGSNLQCGLEIRDCGEDEQNMRKRRREEEIEGRSIGGI
jgi:hypothetical protein